MLNDKQGHTDGHGRSRTQSQDIFRVSSVDFPLTIYFHKTNQKKKSLSIFICQFLCDEVEAFLKEQIMMVLWNEDYTGNRDP